MKTWKDLEEAIDAYHRDHRHPSKDMISLSGLFDLYPNRQQLCALSIEGKWPETWPNAGKKGVYIVFNEQLHLLYIGKASMNNTIGGRLCAWFVYDSDKSCKATGTWNSAPRYLATIGFPDHESFESPALEEYLILKLNPPENIRGRKSS